MKRTSLFAEPLHDRGSILNKRHFVILSGEFLFRSYRGFWLLWFLWRRIPKSVGDECWHCEPQKSLNEEQRNTEDAKPSHPAPRIASSAAEQVCITALDVAAL